MKKSYNPFEMCGSYFGGLLFLCILSILVAIEAFITPIGLREINNLPLQGICSDLGFFSGLGCILFFGMLSFLILFLIGFLIGWGIHSLARYL